MRSAVISDIHGNLEALQQVLDYLTGEASVDQVCCLGDVVGYGADPVACLERCRRAAAFILRGNHDHVVADPSLAEWFNSAAAAAARWTHEQLSVADREFCASLPYLRTTETATYVHATPDDPEAWNYLCACEEAAPLFDAFETPVCFVGHSHVPLVCSQSGDPVRQDGTWQLDPKDRTVINVGSVGQPRDGDPRACFGIFDDTAWTFTCVRLDYDVETAMRKIREAGLPERLAARLALGA